MTAALSAGLCLRREEGPLLADRDKVALLRYFAGGNLLDCTHATTKAAHSDDDSPNAPLKCDDDPPQNGSMVFKAGTNQSQHIVAIEMKDGKVLVQLIYIAAWKHGEGK